MERSACRRRGRAGPPPGPNGAAISAPEDAYAWADPDAERQEPPTASSGEFGNRKAPRDDLCTGRAHPASTSEVAWLELVASELGPGWGETPRPKPRRPSSRARLGPGRGARSGLGVQESQKPPAVSGWGLLGRKIRRRPTLPQRSPCSTIGASGLNFRVRDGIGWCPTAKVTGKRKSGWHERA